MVHQRTPTLLGVGAVTTIHPCRCHLPYALVPSVEGNPQRICKECNGQLPALSYDDGIGTPSRAGNRDNLMKRCVNKAWDLFKGDDILSHERVAYNVGDFVFARLKEQPDTAERELLLSIAGFHVSVATYLSNGLRPITSSLAVLIRMAHRYSEHPDYDEGWRP